MEIEEGTATFTINTIGDVNGQTYMGTFKVHCILTPMQFLAADELYRTLIGPVRPEEAHEHAQNVAFALSQLKHRVISPPPFWEHPEIPGGHIRGADNVVIEVLNLAMDAESKYRQERISQHEEIEKMLAKKMKSGQIEKELDDDEKEALKDEAQKKLEEEEIDI